MNGVEVVVSIRQLCHTPIVMLSSSQDSQVIVHCIQAGADDYITIPFSPEELVARCTSVLRRSDEADFRFATPFIYDDGYLAIDLQGRRILVNGRRIRLTPTEFQLLDLLVGEEGSICTFAQIKDSVWGDIDPGAVEKIHTFIWQLRTKIEPNPKKPIYIISEHSIGYRFQINHPAVT
jgi:two-component system KDP operon response regulator KdpE